MRYKWRCLIDYMTLELRLKVRTLDNNLNRVRIQMTVDPLEKDEIIRAC